MEATTLTFGQTINHRLIPTLEESTPPIPRDFRTNFEPSFLETYHKGTMNYTYKGISCLKDPIDLVLI
jgi:hypothetical protein